MTILLHVHHYGATDRHNGTRGLTFIDELTVERVDEYDAEYYSVPLSEVITHQCIAAVFLIINLKYLVIPEIRKRKHNEPQFKSKTLKWLHLLIVVGGFCHSFTFMIHYVNGLCHFISAFSEYIRYALPIFVGFYQLSRLYHCFADKRALNRYPKCLFGAMTIFGVLYLVWYFWLNWHRIYSECGFQRKRDTPANITYHYDKTVNTDYSYNGGCVIAKQFNWQIDRMYVGWGYDNGQNHYQSYVDSISPYDWDMWIRIYWSSYYQYWVIFPYIFVNTAWYYCKESHLNDCKEGTWTRPLDYYCWYSQNCTDVGRPYMWSDNSWLDDNATVFVGIMDDENGECMATTTPFPTIQPTTNITGCVITKQFDWELDSVYTEYGETNGQSGYGTTYNGYIPYLSYNYSPMYIYWSSYYQCWIISPIVPYWYSCSEYHLNDCKEGMWTRYWSPTNTEIDDSATVAVGIYDREKEECTMTTAVPTTAPTVEPTRGYVFSFIPRNTVLFLPYSSEVDLDPRTFAEYDMWGTGAYVMWDVTTLLLLVLKLRSFTNSVNAISSSSKQIILGIQRKLRRIIILTIFYMTMTTLTATYFIMIRRMMAHNRSTTLTHRCFGTVLGLLTSTTMSYAVFLMESHNSKEYGVFLKRLISVKLQYCCCCYRDDIKSQRDQLLQQMQGSCGDLQMVNTSREETATAFNDFSMNESPGTEYKTGDGARIVSLMDTYSKLQTVMEQKEEGDSQRDGQYHIPMNDFLFEADSKSIEAFSSGFSFGVYLEYWRPNRHNSVVPKYMTLKEELIKNRHATITEEEYERLHRKCTALQETHKFIAKDIGTMNRVCGITPGSEMTVDHMISVKLYTDFTEQQNEFKRHCRRMYRDEPVQSVMERNKEIAHWCRLLRESIMFYGKSMCASDVVYCGLSVPLIFRSLNTRFECPLSTTKTLTVAEQFTEGGQGIILQLKRGNPQTRCLDVGPFTVFKNEDERLFSGSTLKIIDILLNVVSLKQFINALRMLEEIANGYFISGGQQTRDLLLALLQRVVGPSVIDSFEGYMARSTLRQYFDDGGYDTDAVMEDIADVNDSNITMMTSDGESLFEVITRTQDNLLDAESIPNYVWCLIYNFLDEMKVMMEKGTLWMNHHQLDGEGFEAIKEVLFGDGQIFDVLSIDKERIPMVQRYQWMVTDVVYEELKGLPISEYISSPQFAYDLTTESESHRIAFHFQFYGQYSVEEPQCAIFLELDDIPDGVKRVRIEVDMKCYKKGNFRHLLRSRILSEEQHTAGFITFNHEEVERNEMMQWVFAVKVFKVEKHEVDEEGEYLRDLFEIFV